MLEWPANTAGSALAAKAAKPKAEAGIEKGFEPPLESAKRQAGDAQKKALPEGAFNPSVREDRNARYGVTAHPPPQLPNAPAVMFAGNCSGNTFLNAELQFLG